jgi:hypothetical protein
VNNWHHRELFPDLLFIGSNKWVLSHLSFFTVLHSLLSHDDIHVIHHHDVRPDTLTRYTRVIARLVFLVLRCHQGWDCEYSMELTKDQADACQELLDILRSRGQEWSMEHESDFCEDGVDEWGDIDAMGVPSENTDDDIHDDIHSLFNDDSPMSLDLPTADEIATNPIQASLLRLLLSLFTHLPTGRDDKFWSPIIRVIILCSVGKKGKWLAPRQISQIFAALLFCGRLLMMVLMHRQVLSNPDIRYAAYVL